MMMVNLAVRKRRKKVATMRKKKQKEKVREKAVEHISAYDALHQLNAGIP
jgi:hypothetical protein